MGGERHRHLKFDGDFTVGGKPLFLVGLVKDERAQLETGLNVWDGGILLARYLESVTVPQMLRAGKKQLRCLELRAGTGVGGLAFAILGQEAIISDKESLSSAIQGNK